MPTSFYVFQQAYGNTHFRMTLYDTVNGTSTKTISIPDGNYNALSIGSTLQTSLDEAFAPRTFTVGVSQSTLQVSIENIDGYEIEIHTDDVETYTAYVKTLPYFLGFRFNTPVKGQSIVSHDVVKMNPFTYAMIDIRELGTASHEGGMYGSRYGPSSSVFAKIPINNNSFEYTYWEPQNTTLIDFNPVVARLDKLTVHWRFHDMTPIDFQNMDHSFTIEFVTKDDRDTRLDTIVDGVTSIAQQINVGATATSGYQPDVRDSTSEPSTVDRPSLMSNPTLIVISLVSVTLVVWFMTRRPAQ